MYGGAEGQQTLVGADVAGRLLPADVLLASLHREHEAAFAVAVHGLADEPARHLADISFAARQHAKIRAAVTHRRTQALAFSDGDVSPILAGPLEQTEADWIKADDEQR